MMTEERLNAPSLKKLLADARREGAEAERAEWMSCALVDALMEGPALKGWNRSALDRLWKRMQDEHRRDNRWFFEDGRQVGAEEMRERAAQEIIAIATEEANELRDGVEALHFAAFRVRALPLTPGEQG